MISTKLELIIQVRLTFVVIDKNGKLASTTNTLSSYFGSGDFMKEGFYMNNSLGDFSKDSSSPNYGEPHKAPRSFISPSIVVGPNFYMGIGTQVVTKSQQY